jgi:hypothetical protein
MRHVLQTLLNYEKLIRQSVEAMAKDFLPSRIQDSKKRNSCDGGQPRNVISQCCELILIFHRVELVPIYIYIYIYIYVKKINIPFRKLLWSGIPAKSV